MKKLFAILMALVMVLSFAACGQEEEPVVDEQNPDEKQQEITDTNEDEHQGEYGDRSADDCHCQAGARKANHEQVFVRSVIDKSKPELAYFIVISHKNLNFASRWTG